MTGRPAAVLWDLDGTLADSEGVWKDAEGAFAARHGRGLPADYGDRTIGGTMRATAVILKDLTGSPLSLEAIADEITAEVLRTLARPPFPWRPGAADLVDGLARRGVTQAVVTTSRRVVVDPLLAHLPADTLATVVAFEDTVDHKPDPAPYLLACERLGVAASDCLVIEDSGPGMAAGLAAGCLVVGVPTGAPPRPDPRLRLFDTLVGVTPDTLRGLLDGAA